MPAESVFEVGIRIDPLARHPKRSRLPSMIRAVMAPVSRYAETVINVHYIAEECARSPRFEQRVVSRRRVMKTNTLFGALFSRLTGSKQGFTHIRSPAADKHPVSKVLLLCCAAAFGIEGQTVTVTATPVNASFTYQIGAVLPAAQTVSVKSSAGTLAFTTAIAGTNTLWLTVSPDSGKLPASLSLRANPTSLAVGTYSATVTVTMTGITNPLNIPVTLAVTAPPSTVTLSATTLNFTAPPIPPASQTVTLSTSGTPISYSVASGA